MKNKLGYTLVELAVVIIIIGLILAGIVKGQELLKSSKLNTYASEITQYTGAYHQFISTYRCVPGDCAKAEAFFGAANTDNGDGDGLILTVAERYYGWNQLGLAELIPGSYTFAAAVSGGTFLVGENIPGSVINSVGFMLYSNPSDIDLVPGSTYNMINIGKRRSDGFYHAAYFTPSEAFAVDNKIDDGSAMKGSLVTSDGYDVSAGAWFSNTCTDAQYDYLYSNDDTVSCRQIYVLGKWY